MYKDKKIAIVIPARLQSERLPQKILSDIEGLPLIVRTYRTASQSETADDIFAAIDSIETEAICKRYQIDSIMTESNLKSGTDRIYSALNKVKKEYDYIINVQADEPMISGAELDSLVKSFSEADTDAGTIYKKFENTGDLFSPDNVKVIFDSDKKAIYFSRAVIPFLRGKEKSDYLINQDFFKHIGIYIYKSETLEKFVNLQKSKLEEAEKLEQLRLIENGFSIFCKETKIDLIGIDTEEDLEKIRKIWKNL